MSHIDLLFDEEVNSKSRRENVVETVMTKEISYDMTKREGEVVP